MLETTTVKINYRVDQRIRMVEITRVGVKFLLGLEDFVNITNIRDFEESSGEAFIYKDDYKRLRRAKL